MSKQLEQWVASGGRALPESEFSQAKELADYHPGSDCQNYETALNVSQNSLGEKVIKMRGTAGWSKSARKLMNSLEFKQEDREGEEVLVAYGDQNMAAQKVDDYRLAKFEIRKEVQQDGSILFDDRLFWVRQNEDSDPVTSWRWKNPSAETKWRWIHKPEETGWRWVQKQAVTGWRWVG